VSGNVLMMSTILWFVVRSCVASIVFTIAIAAGHDSTYAAVIGPCAIISPSQIAKATSLSVGPGTPSTVLTSRQCTWTGPQNTRIILTVTDASHMALTVKAQQQAGGVPIAGLGQAAVGQVGAPFTGGGYIVSVVDRKGGFGVSILGPAGNRVRAIALAKLVESLR
jgi:hypothetical protein